MDWRVEIFLPPDTWAVLEKDISAGLAGHLEVHIEWLEELSKNGVIGVIATEQGGTPETLFGYAVSLAWRTPGRATESDDAEKEHWRRHLYFSEV